ncbi:MAG: hypothetical protein Q7S87_04930 [Agitococcus sp.]|nr:hypothetical protein [Agitococcus sp.]
MTLLVKNNEPDIAMAGGGYFNFLHPEKSTIRITDIAHALSNVCRFAGHTREFYSVAQHSVLCSLNCDESVQYEALMHDIAEYVLGDVTRPLKQILGDYKAIEKQVEAFLFPYFDLPIVLPPLVKDIDMIMLATEKRDLMPEHTHEWLDIYQRDPHPRKIRPWCPELAYNMFMSRFNEVSPLNQRVVWTPKKLPN